MKFSNVAVPALMGLANAQDLLLARDIQLDEDAVKVLSGLQARDAEADPAVNWGALTVAAALFPEFKKLLGTQAPATSKRDLTTDDLAELNSLLARDAEADPVNWGKLTVAAALFPLIKKILGAQASGTPPKRDLTTDDLAELNSLLARDAEADPAVNWGMLTIAASLFPELSKLLSTQAPATSKRDLTTDDLAELNSLLARDADAAVNWGRLGFFAMLVPAVQSLLGGGSSSTTTTKRDLTTNDLAELNSLLARDAEADPAVNWGALTVAAALFPELKKIFDAQASGTPPKRDLTTDDLAELNSLLARDADAAMNWGRLGFFASIIPAVQSLLGGGSSSTTTTKRDLTTNDLAELNSLLARDAEADPAVNWGALTVAAALFPELKKIFDAQASGTPPKRDLTTDDLAELNSLLARDAEAAVDWNRLSFIAMLVPAVKSLLGGGSSSTTTKRDLTTDDLAELNSLLARDAEADPAVNWGKLGFFAMLVPAVQSLLGGGSSSTTTTKRDLTTDDLAELNSLLARDAEAAVDWNRLSFIAMLVPAVKSLLGGGSSSTTTKRDLTTDDLAELNSLLARDAEAAVTPTQAAFFGAMIGPIANWAMNTVLGKPTKRDLTAADIDEFNSLFQRDPAMEKRDLSPADIDAINSLFERDVSLQERALTPNQLLVVTGVFGAAVNWYINKTAPPKLRRDLTEDDLAELHSLFARDLTLQEREFTPGELLLATGTFGAAMTWLINKAAPPKQRRSIAEFAPVVRRDNLVFTPVQFRA